VTDLSAAGVYTDLQGLAGLRRAAHERSPEALRETARQFEGLFLQMMLKSMREALPGDGLFDSESVKFYQGMFDKQVALDLAKDGAIGLADVLYRQLGGEGPASRSPQGLRTPYAAPPVRRGDTGGADRVGDAELPEYATSPKAFVAGLWPAAREAGAALGVAPEVLIAQSALETGWGRKVIRDPQGRSTHNLFGIKAGSGWSGPSAGVSSVEYEGGVAVRRQARFRAYESPAQSFADYVRFVGGNPRYRAALAQAGEADAYLQGLQEAGYATDPRYAEKIRAILGRESFGRQVAALRRL